jgi:hypothetical protein
VNKRIPNLWAGLGLLLFSGSSILYYGSQIRSPRPNYDEGGGMVSSMLLQISARHWEDPIGLVDETVLNNIDEIDDSSIQDYKVGFLRKLKKDNFLPSRKFHELISKAYSSDEGDTIFQISDSINGMSRGSAFAVVQLKKSQESLTVMPVLVPGTNYAEDVEERIRMRYAVTSALFSLDYSSVIGNGLVFDQYQHDGPVKSAMDFHYDRIKAIIRDGLMNDANSPEEMHEKLESALANEAGLLRSKLRSHRTNIPIEAFQTDTSMVVILWVKENFIRIPAIFPTDDPRRKGKLASKPLQTLENMASEFMNAVISPLKDKRRRNLKKELVVLGPGDSSTLDLMLNELESSSRNRTAQDLMSKVSTNGILNCFQIEMNSILTNKSGFNYGDRRIYSPFTTVDGDFFEPLREYSKHESLWGSFTVEEIEYHQKWSAPFENELLGDVFSKKVGFTFDRIGSDKQLVHALIDELWRRRVFLSPHDPDVWRKYLTKEAIVIDANANRRSSLRNVLCCYEKDLLESRKQKLPEGLTHIDECLTLKKWEKDQHHVVLLTEADSLYGTSIVETFANAVQDRQGHLDQVHVYEYLRGLDGASQSFVSRSATPSTENRNGSGKPISGGRPRNVATPTGGKQIDYVQRLEKSILKLRQKLSENGNGKIMAIGVMGHDQYDKLLLIRSLRRTFSDCLFFTTDLDAAFATESEYPYTRNVIVASHFGLTLNEKLQNETLPFRSNYQTSSYYGVLATLLDGRDSPDLPRGDSQIFEIGRSSPINITPDFGVETVHPEHDVKPPLFLSEKYLSRTYQIYGLLILIILWFSNSRRFPVAQGPGGTTYSDDCSAWIDKDRNLASYIWLGITKKRDNNRQASYSFVLFWALLLTVTFVLFYVTKKAIGNLDGGLGEPLEFWEGVSMWPVAMIRLILCVVIIYLIIDIQSIKLDRQRRRFMSIYGERLSKDAAHDPDPFGQTIKGVLNWYFVRSLFWRAPHKIPILDRWAWSKACLRFLRTPQENPELKDWPWTKRRLRFVRALCIFALYILVHFLAKEFGHYFQPVRGNLSYEFDKFAQNAITVCSLFFVACVLDITFHCRSLIIRLNNILDKVDEHAISHDERKQNVNRAVWVVEIVGTETQLVGRLIYYSLGLVLLTLVARSDAFDFYNWPLVVVFLVALVFLTHLGGLAILFVAARQLQYQAVAMVHGISNGAGRLESPLKQKADDAKAHIESVQEGAFQPLFQNELFRLFVITIAGLGGLAGIDRFMFLF